MLKLRFEVEVKKLKDSCMNECQHVAWMLC